MRVADPAAVGVVNPVTPADFPVVVLVIEDGKSAATIARSPTAPEDPFGVARNSFAVCPVAKLAASVPEVVTGEPVTAKTLGKVNPTLVTVPREPMAAQPVALKFAVIPVGAWPVEQSVGVVAAAVAFAAVPLVLLVMDEGRSAATINRNVGAPAEPFGAAWKVFAVSDAKVTASVPAVVMGEPVRLRKLGRVMATLVTVPGLPVPEHEPHTGSVPFETRQAPFVPTFSAVAAEEC